jgi:hypothetical protein
MLMAQHAAIPKKSIVSNMNSARYGPRNLVKQLFANLFRRGFA